MTTPHPTPTTTEDILNRHHTKQQIMDILRNFHTNCNQLTFKKGIYIYGSPGCGKTTFVNEILREMNYDIINYDAGDIRNKSMIDTITSNNISSYNVLNMMQGQVKRIAIVMDEIDGMNNGDKGGITALIKLIRQKKTKKQRLEQKTMNPIICIGNYYIDKKIRELMKVCHTYELKAPTHEQMKTLIQTKIAGLNPPLLSKIVDYCNNDLQKWNFIENIYISTPELINEKTIDDLFYLKSYNEDTKKITKTLINQPIPIERHSNYMNETDRTIVALLWHENIIEPISKLSNERALPFYLRVLDNICFADFIDRITFQNQIWQFNEMSSLIKTFYNNKIYHDTFSSEKKPQIDEIRFTKVLTKYSTEYNNILFIYNLCQILDMDKKDLITLFQELRLYFGMNFYNQIEKLNTVNLIFEEYGINKLDIKRMYRFLDKNVKKDVVIEECSDEEIE
jgi:DNA polymerase III delta prime subunit